jgi:hypothetical protein
MLAEPRVDGEHELAVEVPESLADDRGVLHPPRGLEQELARGQPGGRIPGVLRQALQLLERRRAARLVERREEDLPDVPPHCLLDPLSVDEAELGEERAERAPLGERRLRGSIALGST